MLLHGTAIAIKDRVALLVGPSGAGKSDLALRCLLHGVSELLPDPARLVADDQIRIRRIGDRLVPEVPQSIRGKLEVRGLGILDVPVAAGEALSLVLMVELLSRGPVERLPDPLPTADVCGLAVPKLAVVATEPSAPAKVLLALGRGL